jgi:hypothetical protein
MSRHAQRASRFGAAESAVAAGNQAAYRRQSVTRVSTGRPVQCILTQDRPVPRCTPLPTCRLRSAIPIHIRHKSIQVQLAPIRDSLTKALIALLTTNIFGVSGIGGVN